MVAGAPQPGDFGQESGKLTWHAGDQPWLESEGPQPKREVKHRAVVGHIVFQVDGGTVRWPQLVTMVEHRAARVADESTKHLAVAPLLGQTGLGPTNTAIHASNFEKMSKATCAPLWRATASPETTRFQRAMLARAVRLQAAAERTDAQRLWRLFAPAEVASLSIDAALAIQV